MPHVDIDALFDFHGAPNTKRADLHQRIRDLFKTTAREVLFLLPSDSPERTRAVRLLADAMREVNYAISIGQGVA